MEFQDLFGAPDASMGTAPEEEEGALPEGPDFSLKRMVSNAPADIVSGLASGIQGIGISLERKADAPVTEEDYRKYYPEAGAAVASFLAKGQDTASSVMQSAKALKADRSKRGPVSRFEEGFSSAMENLPELVVGGAGAFLPGPVGVPLRAASAAMAAGRMISAEYDNLVNKGHDHETAKQVAIESGLQQMGPEYLTDIFITGGFAKAAKIGKAFVEAKKVADPVARKTVIEILRSAGAPTNSKELALGILKKAVPGALMEGVEEIPGAFITAAAEAKAKDPSMSWVEAYQATAGDWRETLAEGLDQAITGVISGGILSGPTVAVGAYRGRQALKTLKEHGYFDLNEGMPGKDTTGAPPDIVSSLDSKVILENAKQANAAAQVEAAARETGFQFPAQEAPGMLQPAEPLRTPEARQRFIAAEEVRTPEQRQARIVEQVPAEEAAPAEVPQAPTAAAEVVPAEKSFTRFNPDVNGWLRGNVQEPSWPVVAGVTPKTAPGEVARAASPEEVVGPDVQAAITKETEPKKLPGVQQALIDLDFLNRAADQGGLLAQAELDNALDNVGRIIPTAKNVPELNKLLTPVMIKIAKLYKAAGLSPAERGKSLFEHLAQYRKGDLVDIKAAISGRPTGELRSWFGKSKVVDKLGKPMILYHGTDSRTNFEEFKTGESGAHFGTVSQANSRIGMSGEIVRQIKKQGGPESYQERRRIYPVYLKIENPKRVKDTGGGWADVIEQAKSEGYDGLVYKNRFEARGKGGDSWVAFYPEQIKPVFGNIEPGVEPSVALANAITSPSKSYSEGEKSKGNVYVKTVGANIPNTDRVLLLQISESTGKRGAGVPRLDDYLKKLYENRDGYLRPKDFMEIPTWISIVANSVEAADVYVVRDLEVAARFLNSAGYGTVMVSVMEEHKEITRDLLRTYPGRVLAGGYVEPGSFSDIKNVEWSDNLGDAYKKLGVKESSEGSDYRHFKDTESVPRLELSCGCKHNCLFCDIPKISKFTEASWPKIQKQIESFKALKYKLVYLNDKTFGQAKNYKMLPMIYDIIKKQNPDFEGFIIQTTAVAFDKLEDEFLAKAHLRYVEFGVESFNDEILAKVRKPHRTMAIEQAAARLRKFNIGFVPNVMIGLAGANEDGSRWSETPETYRRTMDFLRRNEDIISHVNAYILAVWHQTDIAKQIGSTSSDDQSENNFQKSWMEGQAWHEAFYNELIDFSMVQLDKGPQAKKSQGVTMLGRPNVQNAVGLATAIAAQRSEKTHVTVGEDKIPITIETPAGTLRIDRAHEEPQWKFKMKDHYGYVDLGPMGTDGEKIDIWVGDKLSKNNDVYIVDQHTKLGTYDEPKAIIGVEGEAEALALYDRNNPPGSPRYARAIKMSSSEFVAWLEHANLKAPVRDQAPISEAQWRASPDIRPSSFSDLKWSTSLFVQEAINEEYNRYLLQRNLPAARDVKDSRPASLIAFEKKYINYLDLNKGKHGVLNERDLVFVSDIRLNREQKAASNLAKIHFAKRVYYFKTSNPLFDVFLGFYDNETDTLILNSEAKEPMAFVVGHELTHRLERVSPEDYFQLKSLFMKHADMEEFKEALKYRRQYHPGMTKEEFENEYLANYIGVMFEKKDFWISIYKTDKNFFQRLYEFINNALNDLLGVSGSNYNSEAGRYILEEYRDKVDSAVIAAFSKYSKDAQASAKIAIKAQSQVAAATHGLQSAIGGGKFKKIDVNNFKQVLALGTKVGGASELKSYLTSAGLSKEVVNRAVNVYKTATKWPLPSIKKTVDRIIEYDKLDPEAKHWYGHVRLLGEVAEGMGGDKEAARALMTYAIAGLSSKNAGPQQNIDNMIRIYKTIWMGAGEVEKMLMTEKELRRLFDASSLNEMFNIKTDQFGIEIGTTYKMRNYAQTFIANYRKDPVLRAALKTVVDSWMIRYYYPHMTQKILAKKSVILNPLQQESIQQYMRAVEAELTKRTGQLWFPDQAQAVLWFWIRDEWLKTGKIKALTEGLTMDQAIMTRLVGYSGLDEITDRVAKGILYQKIMDPGARFVLDHYAEGDWRVLDPEFQGTGKPGREWTRQILEYGKPIRPMRVHLYKAGESPEKQFQAMKKLRAVVDSTKIYPISKDPNNYKKQFGLNHLGDPDQYALAEMEKQIVSDGWIGMQVEGVTVLFYPAAAAELHPYVVSFSPMSSEERARIAAKNGWNGTAEKVRLALKLEKEGRYEELSAMVQADILRIFNHPLVDVARVYQGDGRYQGGNEFSIPFEIESANKKVSRGLLAKLLTHYMQMEGILSRQISKPDGEPMIYGPKGEPLIHEEQAPSRIIEFGKRLTEKQLQKLSDILQAHGIGGSTYLPAAKALVIHHVLEIENVSPQRSLFGEEPVGKPVSRLKMNFYQFEKAIEAIYADIFSQIKNKPVGISHVWFSHDRVTNDWSNDPEGKSYAKIIDEGKAAARNAGVVGIAPGEYGSERHFGPVYEKQHGVYIPTPGQKVKVSKTVQAKSLSGTKDNKVLITRMTDEERVAYNRWLNLNEPQEAEGDFSVHSAVAGEAKSDGVDSRAMWFSRMQERIKKDWPKKGTPKFYLDMFKKMMDSGKFVKEEVEWSGVTQWLESLPEDKEIRKSYLSEKSEGFGDDTLLGYLEDNFVVLKERIYGEPLPKGAAPVLDGRTVYSDPEALNDTVQKMADSIQTDMNFLYKAFSDRMKKDFSDWSTIWMRWTMASSRESLDHIPSSYFASESWDHIEKNILNSNATASSADKRVTKMILDVFSEYEVALASFLQLHRGLAKSYVSDLKLITGEEMNLAQKKAVNIYHDLNDYIERETRMAGLIGREVAQIEVIPASDLGLWEYNSAWEEVDKVWRYGNNIDESFTPPPEPKYLEWNSNIPGEYREIVFTIPQREARLPDGYEVIKTEHGYGVYKLGKLFEGFFDHKESAVAAAFNASGAKMDSPYTHSHWSDEVNPIAHARYKIVSVSDMINYSNGKWESLHSLIPNIKNLSPSDSILMIEEFQSDWHTAGRFGGYATGVKANIVDPVELDKLAYGPEDKDSIQVSGWAKKLPEYFLTIRYMTLMDEYRQAYKEYKEYSVKNIFFKNLVRASVELRKFSIATGMKDFENKISPFVMQTSLPGDGVVPDAPFKKVWPRIVMKRIVRIAAENGAKGIMWFDGKVQRDRYNLSDSFRKIKIEARRDGMFRVDAFALNGRNVNTYMSISKLNEEFGSGLLNHVLSNKLGTGEAMSITDYVEKIGPKTAKKNKSLWYPYKNFLEKRSGGRDTLDKFFDYLSKAVSIGRTSDLDTMYGEFMDRSPGIKNFEVLSTLLFGFNHIKMSDIIKPERSEDVKATVLRDYAIEPAVEYFKDSNDFSEIYNSLEHAEEMINKFRKDNHDPQLHVDDFPTYSSNFLDGFSGEAASHSTLYDNVMPKAFNESFGGKEWGSNKLEKFDPIKIEARKEVTSAKKYGGYISIFSDAVHEKVVTNKEPDFYWAVAGIPAEAQEVIERTIGAKKASIRDRLAKALKEFTANWKTRMFDTLHPIKVAFGEMSDAYIFARGTTGVESTVAAMMEHGKLRFDPDKNITVDTVKEGFVPWLKSLGPDSQKFFYWLVAKRSEALSAQGREKLFNDEDRRKLMEWIGSPTTKATWEEINAEFQSWNNSVLDLAQAAGIINPERRAVWQSEIYIPFYRVMEDEASLDEYTKGPHRGARFLSAQIKQLKGSEAKIGDPVENIVRNWTHLIGESMRNRARLAAYEAGIAMNETTGMASLTPASDDTVPTPLIENVSWSDTVVFRPAGKKATFVHQKTGEPILNVLINGDNQFFRVNDPELFAALSQVNPAQFDHWFFRAAAGAKGLLTRGATFGPAFKIANMLRDSMHTFMISDSFVPFLDTAKGIMKVWRKDKAYVEFMASGNSFSGSYIRAENSNSLGDYVNRIVKREGTGFYDRLLNTPKKILHFWDKIGDASENAARVQLYANLRKKGRSIAEAGFLARDLLDFNMRGADSFVRALTTLVPFTNARMQGLYKMGRAGMASPKQFALKGLILAAASMGLWLAYYDDDRYKELEEWEKWTYYHFWIGDQHFRIPKPFETGVITSSLWEATFNVMSGNEELSHLRRFFQSAISDTFAMNPIPQLVRPAIEQVFNVNMFTGRPIENQRLQRLPSGMRSESWTSDTLKTAGEALGISPKRMEAIINGYFSTFGLMALGISDAVIHMIGDYPQRPAGSIDDYPAVGRFLRDSKKPGNTKYMVRFYDISKEADALAGAVRVLQESGRFEDASQLIEKNRKLFGIRKLANRVESQISKVSTQIRNVWMSRTLTSAEKRERIDVLVGRRNELARQMVELYGGMK